MADEAIGDAAEATAAEGGAVLLIPNPEAESSEHESTAIPPDTHCSHCAEHETRILMLEQRLNDHTLLQDQLRTDIDSRALAQHDHPVNDDIRMVAEELRAINEEEVAPRRGIVQRGWLMRAGRGQRSA